MSNLTEEKPVPVEKTGFASALNHLRSYQKRDYRDVLARCERVRSVLYVAFMGSGKTVLAAAVIRKWVASGDRVLIVTHTREILRQTHDKLVAAGVSEEQIGWIWRDHARTNSKAAIQLASLDTLARRDFPEGITRIVIDEAHHATAKKWRDVLAAYPSARVLGLTGTPVRLDGQPLGAVFEEMIESESTESLIEQGWIAQPSYWTPAWNIELPRRSGADFGDLVAAGMIPHSKVLESMVSEYSKHAAGLPALGFAATREKAIQYATHFTASGIAADTLFGSDTDLKRQGTLARLRKGTLRVLWTCNVLGEGWDYPGLRCVMLARPTLSIARYLQQVARCMRPGEPPVVLDLWGAWSIFDPPWADFGWSLQTKARMALHVGERRTTGEVIWLPPVEVEGELVRADASMRVPCAVCGKPATRSSSFNSKYRGNKPYCADHAGGPAKQKQRLPCAVCGEPATRNSTSGALKRGSKAYCAEHARGLKANLPPLPCATCGEPATQGSSSNARNKEGRKPYCAEHKGGPTVKLSPLSCAICGAPATRNSTKLALRRGQKAYCDEHKRGPSAALPPIPCTICGKPATKSSSINARLRGQKAYCDEHRGGPSAKQPLPPCAICGEPATRSSALSARHNEGKAYCMEHKRGLQKSSKFFPPLPCTICGAPATQTSSETARLQGHKPYCENHKGGGGRPLLPCAICGEPATLSSSNCARGKKGKAYCETHRKGPVAVKPLLPCATCGAPATRTSSNSARISGRKPYCEKHKKGPRAKLPPLLCAICREPATAKSSRSARHTGGKPYCIKHKGRKK